MCSDHRPPAVLLALTAAFAIPLIFDTLPDGALFFFAMVLRMCVLGAYSTLLVVTAEVFPTKIRATGVSMCGAVARIAGIITPFVAEIKWDGQYGPARRVCGAGAASRDDGRGYGVLPCRALAAPAVVRGATCVLNCGPRSHGLAAIG